MLIMYLLMFCMKYQTYHVKGQLGIATDDGTDEGNTLYRTTYREYTCLHMTAFLYFYIIFIS